VIARALVDAARAAGADAVKFQTFRADRLASAAAPKADYQTRGGGDRESQQDMLRRLELSEDAHRAIIDHCRTSSIAFLSSPFDEESADLLERLEVPAFKVSSGELTNHGLLAHLARKGRPLLLSTGMATLSDVESAVAAVRSANAAVGLALLHCVSCYPADPADANLRAMDVMRAAFQCPIGYSDHTPGLEVALAAVARGACVIEKHLTVDRNLPGPDHAASLEPAEFSALVRGVRTVERALGHGRKEPAAAEAAIAAVARRSWVAAHDIDTGAVVTRDRIHLRRPGDGFPPQAEAFVVGRRAAVRIPAGTVLRPEMLQ
jgi:sialic acid synthase SpsE